MNLTAAKRLLLFSGSMLTAASMAFAMSSHFWISFVFREKRYHSGLWSVCAHGGDCDLFSKWLTGEDDPKWIEQCRVLIIIACVTTSLSIVTSVLGLYNEKVKSFVSALFMLVTAVLTAGCIWIYTQRKDYHNEHFFENVQYEWGFIVACVTTSLAIVFMIFGALADFTCSKKVPYGFVNYI